jgi:ZIP family zinc transporter
MSGIDPVFLGFIGSLFAGLMTTVGALPIVLRKIPSDLARDTMLGFAAGVMLSASFFSLIVPALEIWKSNFGESPVPGLAAITGILLGALLVAGVDHYLPHEHFVSGKEGPSGSSIRRIWLFVIAITIHNFPEGLAVGVGFAGDDLSKGLSLATGIGLQNIPEGLAVAVALSGEGYSRWKAFWIASLTGMIEPIGGLIGAAAVAVSETFLPRGLVIAAGAMLYVISHKIIPETHRRGYQNEATAGLMVGLSIMLFLDVWLG